MFDGIAELVIEELIQEHLCDNLVLITIITQSIRLAGQFEVVDETECFFS